MHWTGQNSSMGRMGAVVNPYTDPHSGQPESKQTPVALKPVDFVYSGSLASTINIEGIDADYWVKNRIDHNETNKTANAASGYRFHLAYNESINWREKFEETFGEDVQILEFTDRKNESIRIAAFVDGKIAAVAYQKRNDHQGQAAASDSLPHSSWLTEILGSSSDNPVGILAGKTPETENKGKLICSCFKVGKKQICAAIKNGADTPEELGTLLKCGTNCGSCIPELKQLITQVESEALIASEA